MTLYSTKHLIWKVLNQFLWHPMKRDFGLKLSLYKPFIFGLPLPWLPWTSMMTEKERWAGNFRASQTIYKSWPLQTLKIMELFQAVHEYWDRRKLMVQAKWSPRKSTTLYLKETKQPAEFKMGKVWWHHGFKRVGYAELEERYYTARRTGTIKRPWGWTLSLRALHWPFQTACFSSNATWTSCLFFSAQDLLA